MCGRWTLADFRVALVGAAVALSACGGGGGGSSAPPSPTPPVANVPPTANAGADQVVLVGTTVNLSGSGTDTDGTIATLAWTQTGGGAVTLSATNIGTPSFTAPSAAAALVFELAVTDNAGATRSDTVTVNVNAPPVANAGADQTVNGGTSVTLQGNGTDANGTVASYAWTQTAGPAVSMTGTNTATLAFTAPAPATASGLTFQLTVTDNQQATHNDTITVTVNSLAAPVIVRQPTNPNAVQHGSALMFLVASGENLNYEWHSNAFGTIVKTGPEPFLLRAGDLAHVGEHCYYVVVSNSAGSVTSDLGCMTVEDLTENLDPSDPELEDRYLVAEGYGGMLFGIAQNGAGLLTGATLFGGGRTSIPHAVEAAHACLFGGSYVGTTLDGQALATARLLPLGEHTISLIWNSCRKTEDDIEGLAGGMLVHYDFPNEFGVGSFTMHLSGLGQGFSTTNGTLQVTQARSLNSLGRTVDDVDITIVEDFSGGNFRKTSGLYNTIEVLRTMNADGTAIVEADVDFDVILTVFDGNGYAATAGQESGGIMHLIFDPVPGDNNIPAHRSNSTFGALIGDLPNGAPSASVTLRPNGGSGSWGFSVVYPPDPDDD